MAPPNIMKEHSRMTPRHYVYIATSVQISNQYWKDLRCHGKKYTYLAVYIFHRNKKHFPRQLRERELHAREYTIQCLSFKFPIATRHVHVVVHITYVQKNSSTKIDPETYDLETSIAWYFSKTQKLYGYHLGCLCLTDLQDVNIWTQKALHAPTYSAAILAYRLETYARLSTLHYMDQNQLKRKIVKECNVFSILSWKDFWKLKKTSC